MPAPIRSPYVGHRLALCAASPVVKRRFGAVSVAAVFLIGSIPVLIAAPVTSAQQSRICAAANYGPWPENCYDVYESMMQRCAGMPRGDRKRCERAAFQQLADCQEKEKGYIGGGRF